MWRDTGERAGAITGTVRPAEKKTSRVGARTCLFPGREKLILEGYLLSAPGGPR